MANHLAPAAIATILAKTVGACKPGELKDIMSALDRLNYVEGPDHDRSVEPTCTTIFGVTVTP